MDSLIPHLQRKLSLGIAAPNEDITSIDVLKGYIHQNVSYALVPGYENSAVFDPEELIVAILPFSQFKLLDICLPYFQVKSDKSIVRHLGRYLVSNMRLLGVRICVGENWKRHQVVSLEIPDRIQRFYREKNIQKYPESLMVGDFFFTCRQFKMALIFQSQLTEENIQNTLTQNYLMGCQIFSIVGNVTKSVRDKSKVLTLLRNFQKQSTILMYGSVILAPTMMQVYYSQSFIQQGFLIKTLKVQHFKPANRMIFEVSLDAVRQKRNYSIKSTVQLDSLKNLISNQRIKFWSLQVQKQQKYESRFLSRAQVSSNLNKQLFLWFICKKIYPYKFTIALPLTKKTSIIIQLLRQISQCQNQDLSVLLQFFSQTKLQAAQERSFNSPLVLQSVEKMVEQSLQQTIYLFHDGQKSSTLKRALKNSDSIYMCMGCFPQTFFQLQGDEERKVQEQLQEYTTFVQKFLNKRAHSIQNFYLDIIKHFSGRANEMLFKKLFEIMKEKIRTNLKNNPFYLFVMKTSFEQIKLLLTELQIKIGLGNSIKKQASPIVVQSHQNSFQNIIRSIKKYAQNQRKGYFGCHICKTIISKKQKSNWGKKCLSCNNFICYYCYDLKTGQIAQNQTQCALCLVCSGQCSCIQCKKKLGQGATLNKSFSKLQPQVAIKDYGTFLKQEKYDSKCFVQLRTCQKCFIMNRSSKNIQFECLQCDQIFCLACQRAAAPSNVKFNHKKPLCSQCGHKQVRQMQAKSFYYVMLQKQRDMQKKQYEKLALTKTQNKLEKTIIQEVEKQFSQSSHQNGQEQNFNPAYNQSAQSNIAGKSQGKNSSVGSRSPSPKRKKRKNSSDSDQSKGSGKNLRKQKKQKMSQKASNSSKNSQTPQKKEIKKLNYSSGSDQSGQVKNYNKPLWNQNRQNKKRWKDKSQNFGGRNDQKSTNSDDWNIGKGSYNKTGKKQPNSFKGKWNNDSQGERENFRGRGNGGDRGNRGSQGDRGRRNDRDRGNRFNGGKCWDNRGGDRQSINQDDHYKSVKGQNSFQNRGKNIKHESSSGGKIIQRNQQKPTEQFDY